MDHDNCSSTFFKALLNIIGGRALYQISIIIMVRIIQDRGNVGAES